MKTNYVLFGVVCVFVLLVSMAVAAAAEVAEDKPMNGEVEGELARGRCIHGCCNRNLIGRCKVCCPAPALEAELGAKGRCLHGCCNRNFLGNCKVCCASAEEAKAAGLGAAAGEAEAEAKP